MDSCDHFLAGSDLLWTLKNQSPCNSYPSQDLQQKPLQKHVEEAGKGVRTPTPGFHTPCHIR